MKQLLILLLLLIQSTSAFSCETTAIRENIVKVLEEMEIEYVNLSYRYKTTTRFEKSFLNPEKLETRQVYFRYDVNVGNIEFLPYIGAYEVNEFCELSTGGMGISLF